MINYRTVVCALLWLCLGIVSAQTRDTTALCADFLEPSANDSVLAQTARYMTNATHALDEVVVSGLTGNSKLKDTPSPFAVIGSVAINQTLSQNIIQALGHQPGLAEVSTGPGISKPVIRGLGYNRIVTVVNGIRQEGQQWGDEHGIEVDGYSVGSVEILKGPASLMYGSDALAGVLVLRPHAMPQDSTHELDFSSEYQLNNGLIGGSLRYGARLNHLVWQFQGSGQMGHEYHNSANGYVSGTGMQQAEVSGSIGWNDHWGSTKWIVSHFHFRPAMVENASADTNHYHSYHISLPFQRIDHTRVVTDNTVYLPLGTLKMVVGWQYNQRREYEDNNKSADLYLDLNTLNYDFNWLTTDLPHHWHLRTGVGGMVQHSVNKATEILIPDYDLMDIGVYAASEKHLQRFHFSAGVRYDYRYLLSLSKHYHGVSGSVGTICHLTSDMHLKLNASQGYRAPNISELTSFGIHEGTMHFEIGNAQLRPETNTQIDLGWQWSNPYVRMSADLFWNGIRNFIYLQRDEVCSGQVAYDNAQVYRFRQDAAQLFGSEIEIDVHPYRYLHWENGFSYVRGMFINHPSGAQDLPMIPAPRIRSELSYDFQLERTPIGQVLRSLWLSVNGEYNFRQQHIYSQGGTETPTNGYFLLGAAIGVHFYYHNRPLLDLQIIGDNLLDQTYVSHLSRFKYLNGGCVYNMGRNIGFKLHIPISIQ